MIFRAGQLLPPSAAQAENPRAHTHTHDVILAFTRTFSPRRCRKKRNLKIKERDLYIIPTRSIDIILQCHLKSDSFEPFFGFDLGLDWVRWFPSLFSVHNDLYFLSLASCMY